MCGIVGYVGPDEALPIVLEGLRRLEYRGYDSAGVAVLGEELEVRKRSGKLGELEAALDAEPPLGGRVAIGHTRWATHGAPTAANAHPQTDCPGDIAVIHNGIIENHHDLRSGLEKGGHVFASDTDTEVVAHLVEDALGDTDDLTEAVRAVVARARGRVLARRRVVGPSRRAGRREGVLADGGRARQRRDDARLRHPGRARAYPRGAPVG